MKITSKTLIFIAIGFLIIIIIFNRKSIFQNINKAKLSNEFEKSVKGLLELKKNRDAFKKESSKWNDMKAIPYNLTQTSDDQKTVYILNRLFNNDNKHGEYSSDIFFFLKGVKYIGPKYVRMIVNNMGDVTNSAELNKKPFPIYVGPNDDFTILIGYSKTKLGNAGLINYLYEIPYFNDFTNTITVNYNKEALENISDGDRQTGADITFGAFNHDLSETDWRHKIDPVTGVPIVPVIPETKKEKKARLKAEKAERNAQKKSEKTLKRNAKNNKKITKKMSTKNHFEM